MKRKNFPGRKILRRIEADIRLTGRQWSTMDSAKINKANATRSKRRPA